MLIWALTALIWHKGLFHRLKLHILKKIGAYCYWATFHYISECLLYVKMYFNFELLSCKTL